MACCFSDLGFNEVVSLATSARDIVWDVEEDV
jgi:hypothetical protein